MKFAYLIEPPFNHIDASGRVTGCDVELARHVCAALDLGKFEPVETTFAELLPGLAAGRWKMTTGLFATDERRRRAQFSRPIWAAPDGFLVLAGNPRNITGYRSVASQSDIRLAVIRDQVQHRSAIEFGVRTDQIAIFEIYENAAMAVRTGAVDVYASVARAHGGFMELHPDWNLEVIPAPATEKPPAFGSFAIGLEDADFLIAVDAVLADYLGTDAHRTMAASFGFSAAEVDLIAA